MFKHKLYSSKNILCSGIILISIISFTYNGLIRGYKIPIDFKMFYESGIIWRDGGNNYDADLLCSRTLGYPDCHTPYPPIANAIFSLFSYFPVDKSAYLFRIVNLFLLFGIITILGYFLKRYCKLGWFELTLLACFLNTQFSRQNIKLGQLGIIICALLFSTLILIQKHKVYLSSLGIAGILIKPNFYPIFFIYSVIRKEWKILFWSLLISGLLLFLPCLLTGRQIISTYVGWIDSNISNQGVDSSNYGSPNDAYSAQLVYLLPLINRIFNSQSTLITLVNYLILMVAWAFSLLRLASLKCQGDKGFFEFGLISALTLLSVYHREYDTFLLFPGIIIIYLYAIKQVNKKRKFTWLGYLSTILTLITVPGDMTYNLTLRYLFLGESYIWRVLAPLQVWAGVLVVFGLLWLLVHKAIPTVVGYAK